MTLKRLNNRSVKSTEFDIQKSGHTDSTDAPLTWIAIPPF